MAEAMCPVVRGLAMGHRVLPLDGLMTISVGLTAAVPDQELSRGGLLRAADQALYQTKHQGRNRTVAGEVAP